MEPVTFKKKKKKQTKQNVEPIKAHIKSQKHMQSKSQVVKLKLFQLN